MLTRGKKLVFMALYRNKLGVHLRALNRSTGMSLPAVKKIVDKARAGKLLIMEKKGNSNFFRFNFLDARTAAIIEMLENITFESMPRRFREGCASFLKALPEKPLMAVVFGSYATGTFDENSDLDVLLVFQRVDKKLISGIESLAVRVGGRIGLDVQPVTLQYDEFEKKFMDRSDDFMKGVREQAMILTGHTLYIELLGRYLG